MEPQRDPPKSITTLRCGRGKLYYEGAQKEGTGGSEVEKKKNASLERERERYSTIQRKEGKGSIWKLGKEEEEEDGQVGEGYERGLDEGRGRRVDKGGTVWVTYVTEGESGREEEEERRVTDHTRVALQEVRGKCHVEEEEEEW